MLEERYREKFMGEMCTGSCVTNPNALWRETVASTFIRTIYMFSLKTTAEQDRALIDKLNRAGNVGHFNGVTDNCADFARAVVNTYFPRAAKPDHINDFWITSPKAIAKSFAHYGMKHPELEFHVVRYSQIPGEYPASKDNRKGTEELFRANKWRAAPGGAGSLRARDNSPAATCLREDSIRSWKRSGGRRRKWPD